MCYQTEFDLAVIGIEQRTAGGGNEEFTDLPSEFRAGGDVL